MVNKALTIGTLLLAMSCPGSYVNINNPTPKKQSMVGFADLNMEDFLSQLPHHEDITLYHGQFPLPGPRVYATWKIFSTYSPEGKLLSSSEALFIDDYVTNTRIAMNDNPKTDAPIDSARLIDIPTGDIVKVFEKDELDDVTKMYQLFLKWIVAESDPKKESKKNTLEV